MGRHSTSEHLGRALTMRVLAPRRTPTRGRLIVNAGRIVVAMTMLVTVTASAWAGNVRDAKTGADISTIDALTWRNVVASPPAALVSRAGTEESGAPPAATGSDRVSRSMPRTEFRTDDGKTVECSGLVPDIGSNGHVPDASMCDLWQAPYRDRADAVVAITQLNEMYKAKFGEPMCLTSAYRTLEQQAALRRTKPGLAAPVGLSNHGWGLAVDFCSETYTGARGAWLRKNGPMLDWDNPVWARTGRGGPYEPWHWEYVPGVKALVAAGLE
jgi:hypothetical protein